MLRVLTCLGHPVGRGSDGELEAELTGDPLRNVWHGLLEAVGATDRRSEGGQGRLIGSTDCAPTDLGVGEVPAGG